MLDEGLLGLWGERRTTKRLGQCGQKGRSSVNSSFKVLSSLTILGACRTAVRLSHQHILVRCPGHSYVQQSLLIHARFLNPCTHKTNTQAVPTTHQQQHHHKQQKNVEQGYSAASAIPHASSYWGRLLFMYVGHCARPTPDTRSVVSHTCPLSTRFPNPAVLSRVQAFLPQIAEANAKLEERLQAGQGDGT